MTPLHTRPQIAHLTSSVSFLLLYLEAQCNIQDSMKGALFLCCHKQKKWPPKKPTDPRPPSFLDAMLRHGANHILPGNWASDKAPRLRKNILQPPGHYANREYQQGQHLVWGRDRMNILKATSKLLEARAHPTLLDLSNTMDTSGLLISNHNGK